MLGFILLASLIGIRALIYLLLLHLAFILLHFAFIMLHVAFILRILLKIKKTGLYHSRFYLYLVAHTLPFDII